MYFLFSGEGATDFGQCADGSLTCGYGNYDYGPMAVIVDQIVEKLHEYSILDAQCYGYISERKLVEEGGRLKRPKKSARLPGAKRPRDTTFFYDNARALATCAKAKAVELNDNVVAVLFRDSDGTASTPPRLWAAKRQSMIEGFGEKDFARGVAMIPKPKSEAWLLCALRSNPYQDCDALEDRPGNDNSRNSLTDRCKKEIKLSDRRMGGWKHPTSSLMIGESGGGCGRCS